MDTSFHCTVTSEKLDVAAILKKFPLENPSSHKKGDISPSARPYQTGEVSFDAPSLLEGAALIERIQALTPKDKIEGHIHISYEYNTQCNLDFSAAELAAVAKSGSSLSITCYRNGE